MKKALESVLGDRETAGWMSLLTVILVSATGSYIWFAVKHLHIIVVSLR